VNGGQLYISTDTGATWTARESNRGWYSVASSADGTKLAAAADGGQLYTSVPVVPPVTYTAPTTPGTNTLSFQVQDDGAVSNIDLTPNTLTFIVPGYWLDTEAGPHGSVNVGDGWVAAGVTTQITATAAQYFDFTNWTGSVSGGEVYANPLDLLMDISKTVTAHFAQQVTTNTGTPYWWMAQFGITQSFEVAATQDPNSNGYNTAEDYILGLDPTNPASTFQPQVTTLYGTNCYDVVWTNEEPPYEVGTQTICDVAGMLITWPSVSGRVYDIESGLILPGYDWAEWAAGQSITAAPPMNCFTNPLAQMTNAWQFFRQQVRMEP